jgi:transposase
MTHASEGTPEGIAYRKKSAERRQRAVDLKNSGLSNREVGLKLGVSAEWAKSLIKRGRREREYAQRGAALTIP